MWSAKAVVANPQRISVLTLSSTERFSIFQLTVLDLHCFSTLVMLIPRTDHLYNLLTVLYLLSFKRRCKFQPQLKSKYVEWQSYKFSSFKMAFENLMMMMIKEKGCQFLCFNIVITKSYYLYWFKLQPTTIVRVRSDCSDM